VPLEDRRTVHPAPIVVDADVLIRNIEYTINRRRAGALLAGASASYTLMSGIVLFATTAVAAEVFRHVPDVARRTGVRVADVAGVWNEVFAPRVRFVDVGSVVTPDARVAAVRSLHEPDTPTATLVVLLAPAVLATDNRRHFKPLGLPDTKTDAVAIDVAYLGQFGRGITAGALIPTIAGAGVIEGSRTVIRSIGGEAATLLSLLLLGGALLYWQSNKAQALKNAIGQLASELGPPLGTAMDEWLAASKRVAAFAVDRSEAPDALSVVARRLAVGQTAMSTTEIARELRMHDIRVTDERVRHKTATRAWLKDHTCFVEHKHGQWTLGYHGAGLD
jgi:hypothetical protein